MKMPAALHCQFSVVLSLTHLFKPDFLRSWRDGLLLEFIILNLDSGNNRWQTGVATGWLLVRAGGGMLTEPNTSLCSREGFLHSEAELRMPGRV